MDAASQVGLRKLRHEQVHAPRALQSPFSLLHKMSHSETSSQHIR